VYYRRSDIVNFLHHTGGSREPRPDQWIRVVLSGDVDISSAQSLAATLTEAWEQEPLMLEVDLAGVTFLDGAGLGPLVAAHTRLPGRMRLFDPSPAVTRVLHLLGLGDMFVVVGPISATPASQERSRRAGPDGGAAMEAESADEQGLGLSPDDRVTIEQAKGLLMAVNECDAPSAWELLRGHARARDVRIRVMARMLVDHAPGGLPPASESVVDDVIAELARAGPPEG